MTYKNTYKLGQDLDVVKKHFMLPSLFLSLLDYSF